MKGSEPARVYQHGSRANAGSGINEGTNASKIQSFVPKFFMAKKTLKNHTSDKIKIVILTRNINLKRSLRIPASSCVCSLYSKIITLILDDYKILSNKIFNKDFQ